MAEVVILLCAFYHKAEKQQKLITILYLIFEGNEELHTSEMTKL